VAHSKKQHLLERQMDDMPLLLSQGYISINTAMVTKSDVCDVPALVR
jgi:hypothetical protein